MKKFGFWETVWAEARLIVTLRTWKCEAGRVFAIGVFGYRWETMIAVDQVSGSIHWI